MKRCAALALVGLWFVACSQTGNAPASHHGVLRGGTYAEPHSLNPILASNTSDNFLASLAFDELVTIDPKGNDIPDLAQRVPTVANGDIAKNGLAITYHLRRGVRWQDGAPFTSADVKFSWQAVLNPRNNVTERHGYDQIASADTPDPYTIVFRLKRPFAPFVDTVFGESDDPYRIIPQHVLARYSDVNHVPFNTLPIGTGPFRVVRWVHGDHVEYAANPNYFRGKPALRRLIVYVIPDGNTAGAEVRSHQVDFIIDVSAAVYRILRSDPAVKTLLVKAPSYTSIDMNMTRPPLDDLRVRRAIAYAIDEQKIIDELTAGTGTLARADLSDFYWAYSPNTMVYRYDAAKAGQLLDAAGWTRGPSGMRQKNGRTLSLQLVLGAGSPTARAIAVQVQAQLKTVGIDVSVKAYDYALFYATKQLGGILNNGRFDLAEWSWVAGADPDDSQLWTCASVPPNGNNIVHYCSRALDAAENAALAHFDRPTRKQAYARTQALLASDAPAAFMYYTPLRYAMSPQLANFTPNGISEGWNAYQWNI